MRYGWVAAAVVTSACATVTTAQRPAFPKFLTSVDRIFTTASGGGYLTQRGSCLGLASRTGDNFRTVIWPDTANLTVDSGGLIVTDSSNGAAIRLGDYVIVGGGLTTRNGTNPGSAAHGACPGRMCRVSRNCESGLPESNASAESVSQSYRPLACPDCEFRSRIATKSTGAEKSRSP